jgi:hypothetical protein
MIGGTVARLSVAAGQHAVLSNSRGPETLDDLVAELGPLASAGTRAQAAQAGHIVVVSIPLKAYPSVPVAPLAGKTVIDTNNYYPERDGQFETLDRKTSPAAASCRSTSKPPTSSRSSTISSSVTWPRSPASQAPPTAPRCPSRVTTRRPRPRWPSSSTRSATTPWMPARWPRAGGRSRAAPATVRPTASSPTRTERPPAQPKYAPR